MAERTDPVPAAPFVADGATIALAMPTTRYSLRSRNGNGLPAEMLRASPYSGGTAFKLGPDEWLLIGSGEPQVAGAHALVDVSERNLALEITGAKAAALLQTGCPLDLSEATFPIGKATRTLFETIEIVLWRQASDRFHVEVWKSFAPWLWDVLTLNAGDLAA